MRNILGVVPCVGILALPLTVPAGEVRIPTADEVSQAEGNPPLIPHRVTEQMFRKCLGCHAEGKNGAPQTPHPERQTCTQCHVPAEGYATDKTSKKKRP